MAKEYVWHPVVDIFNEYKAKIASGNYKEFENALFELGDFIYEKKDISNIGNIVIGNLEALIFTAPIFSIIAHAKSTANIPSRHRKNIYEALFHGEDDINDIPLSQISCYLDEIDKRYGKILKIAKSLQKSRGSKGDLIIANMHELIKKDDYSLFRTKKRLLLDQILLAKS